MLEGHKCQGERQSREVGQGEVCNFRWGSRKGPAEKVRLKDPQEVRNQLSALWGKSIHPPGQGERKALGQEYLACMVNSSGGQGSQPRLRAGQRWASGPQPLKRLFGLPSWLHRETGFERRQSDLRGRWGTFPPPTYHCPTYKTFANSVCTEMAKEPTGAVGGTGRALGT